MPRIKFLVNESSHATAHNRSDGFNLQGNNKENNLKIRIFSKLVGQD